MEPLFVQEYTVDAMAVDRFGRMKMSTVLYLAQEIAGAHCIELGADYDTLAAKRMFWAVTRHRILISRIPRLGEKLRVETWPMPTTRVAYPRCMSVCDANGNECFRSVSLWVLMDMDQRNMILPDKSGVTVDGILRGLEPEIPKGLPAKELTGSAGRQVCFTDLDRNGHMNNTKYLDWISDLLPSDFHRDRIPREVTVCYLSEAREGQQLDLNWGFPEENCLTVQAGREKEGKTERIFSARYLF